MHPLICQVGDINCESPMICHGLSPSIEIRPLSLIPLYNLRIYHACCELSHDHTICISLSTTPLVPVTRARVGSVTYPFYQWELDGDLVFHPSIWHWACLFHSPSSIVLTITGLRKLLEALVVPFVELFNAE